MASTSLHFSLSLRVLPLLALGLAASTVACSASTSTDGAAGSSDSDITGVTDLGEMESALGLWKDTKKPDGTWSRGDDKLKAGGCYQKTVGGADGASYQFRRYSNGASFFKKLGAGAASGDERPVVCVDVDIDRWYGNQEEQSTMALSDFEVDAVIRYRLGTPQGSEGAAGSSYDSFNGGMVHWSNVLCYGEGSTYVFDSLSPGELAHGCLSGAQFPGSGNEIDGAALLTVYQYAYAKGTQSNRFSADGDAVGRFIKVKGDWQSPEQVLEYENADLHIVRGTPNLTEYKLTPRGAAADAAFYSCRIDFHGDAPATSSCSGL